MGNRMPRRFEKYRRLAFELGATEAKLLPARHIVTAEWVRLKCQFGCSGYNKRLCCPPYTPTPETTRRVLAEYRHALIYAIDGHGDRRYRRSLERQLAAIERAAFLDGLYRALALGAGPCRLCAECDTTRRCRHPSEARPSLESCGVDVYATCRNAGIRLEVVTSETQTPRYIHAVLLD